MRRAHSDLSAGFTLVEFLIAITIFGIMSGFAYRVLDTVLATRERVSDEYRRWRDVARAVASMERDLEAIEMRPVRDASDRLAASLVGAEVLSRPHEAAIAFSRRGDLDESSYRSAPRRMGYRVRNGVLERLTWTGLDQAPRSAPNVTTILSGVVRLGLRYRNAAGQWQSVWPAAAASVEGTSHAGRPASVDATLPTAVGFTIYLATGERISRLIPLYAGARQ